MNERRNDDERIAALLDGRLHDPERRELLAQLANSDDDYDVFTHTAAVLRALEEEEAEEARADEAPAREASVPPAPSTRKPAWRRRARWAAAGVTVFALMGLWVSRERASTGDDPVGVVARLEQPGGGLPVGWLDVERWPGSRGNPATPATAEAQAARAGALLVDLTMAARAGDAATTRLLAVQSAARLEPMSGPDAPLRRIADRPGAPPDSLTLLVQQATDRLADRLGRPVLQLGAWAEAARLAARRRDAAFFHARASRTILRRAGAFTEGDGPVRAAVDRVRAATAAQVPDWNALGEAADTLLRELES